MNTLIRVGALALTLTVGVVIGASNTQTVAADPAVTTKTVVDTVEVAPQSCLDAIEASEDIAIQTRRYVGLTVQMPQMVVRAAKAGMMMDADAIDGVTADMDAFASDTQAITAKIGPLVQRFNVAKTACRAAG